METLNQKTHRKTRAKPSAKNEIATSTESLSDAELVQHVLGDHVDGAGLLAQHGGLKGLLTSEDAPASLRLALELGRRGLKAQEARPRLGTPHTIYEYLAPSLGLLRHEVFHVLCFNARNVLLQDVRVATGTVATCFVDPREVFRVAVRANCPAIVLAHNHPSGDPEPSRQDRDLTAKLVTAGKLLGIKVLDHIIVGDGRYVSFLNRGDMLSL